MAFANLFIHSIILSNLCFEKCLSTYFILLGPSIPEDLRKVLAEREVVKYQSSDEDGIGPLPAGAEEKWSEAHQRLEERALDIKVLDQPPTQTKHSI